MKPAYTPPAEPVRAAAPPSIKRPAPPSVETPARPSEAATRQGELETRVYKGATYVKGSNGEWHILQLPPQPVQAQAAGEAASNVVKMPAIKEAPAVKETPVIAWSTPAAIAYGTPLTTTQLRAMASAPGKFTYTPSLGELLPAGTHTLSVVFTPNDADSYTTAEATVTLSVTKATPKIEWPAPAAVVHGTPLSDAQFNASASVPGRFVYTPSLGEVLAAGTHKLSATFTPADTAGYATAQATATLTVSKATPILSWAKPARDGLRRATGGRAVECHGVGGGPIRL